MTQVILMDGRTIIEISLPNLELLNFAIHCEFVTGEIIRLPQKRPEGHSRRFAGL